MSSSDVAVSVRGLSKSYTIAHNAENHTTAAEALIHRLKNPLSRPNTETFWALKDVDFDIQKGDVVGVIGRNGAGKSTLLKVLSRITEPTTGQIDLYGRVGSLLEVGTGFHPELTGRENVYLNGAILGMKKSEIARQFDAIVDFSGTEQFLDTPVKRYSSGMYVRLAFAVAAHLNPEILIIDEVLAVGDHNFQKKCIGKMQDVAESGRTVIFVSHSMASVLQLCNKGFFLSRGHGSGLTDVQTAVDEYMRFGIDREAEKIWSLDEAPGNSQAKITGVRVLDSEGEIQNEHFISDPVTLEMDFWCGGYGVRLNHSFHLLDAYGTVIFATANSHDAVWGQKEYQPGFYKAQCVIPRHFLNDGHYKVSAFLVQDTSEIIGKSEEVVGFSGIDNGVTRGGYTGDWIGAVRPMLTWEGSPALPHEMTLTGSLR